MKNKILIIIVVLILLGIIVFGINIFYKNLTLKSTDGITVVPTMRDTITTDSSWCGTFQLVWNDMKNEVVKKDIIFTPQEEMADNLNKEEFTQDMISDEYYYKIYGLKSLKLKEEIENGIKEKFDQTSDVLDNLDWSDNGEYLFYSMLYRKFEFLTEFDKLENGEFGNKYNNIQYFGIDENTKNSVGNQIDVLYYNSEDDFAIIVNTKTDDEVIFCKNPQGKNFKEIYENMNENANNYIGSKEFNDVDEFKAPNLNINEVVEYSELEGKNFETNDLENGVITAAIQTIQLSLDEKGGEIKSEAAMTFSFGAEILTSEAEEEPRYFYVNDTFAIFLREKGQSIPYFAGRVEDITKFQ